MAGISSTIQLVDQMTAPIMAIQHAISGLENRFNALDAAADIDSSTLSAMRNQIDMSISSSQVLADNMQLVTDSITNASAAQNNFNDNLSQSNSLASGLAGKIGSAVAVYASFRGIGNVLGISDEMTNVTSRLNMMNDGLQSTAELQNEIFLAAERSRGEYLLMSQTVSKLGLLAGKAFSSNDETIAFAEQMNKQFVIGGSSIQEQTNAMYQLTQAMAAGKLQGDEYRSIIENAPMLAGAIESYMTNAGVEGTMKDWASEGLLTAQVIKDALFSVTDETNARFEQMPKTFGQTAVSIKNQALMAFQPVLNRLNDMANSPSFDTLVNNIVNTMVTVAGVVLGIFDVIGAVAQFASDNWSVLAPVIYGVVAALTVYHGWLLLSAIAQGAFTLAKMLALPVYALMTGATMTETAAQWNLNAAMYACPIVWIIILIIAFIAAIYAIIAAYNKWTGETVSATGVIAGLFMTLAAHIYNKFIVLTWNTLAAFANFFGNVFNDPAASVQILFYDLARTVIGYILNMAQTIENIINKIPGVQVDITSGLDNFFNQIEDASQKVKDESGWVEYMGTLDYLDYGAAFDYGYQKGQDLDNAIADFDPASFFGIDMPKPEDITSGFAPETPDLSGIGEGVSNIDANTKDQLDYAEEEIKFWQDIAERETISRFTTAEVFVDFGGVNNNVSSDTDLDGIIDYMADGVEEALLVTAEGVHFG